MGAICAQPASSWILDTVCNLAIFEWKNKHSFRESDTGGKRSNIDRHWTQTENGGIHISMFDGCAASSNWEKEGPQPSRYGPRGPHIGQCPRSKTHDYLTLHFLRHFVLLLYRKASWKLSLVDLLSSKIAGNCKRRCKHFLDSIFYKHKLHILWLRTIAGCNQGIRVAKIWNISESHMVRFRGQKCWWTYQILYYVRYIHHLLGFFIFEHQSWTNLLEGKIIFSQEF